MSPRGRAAQRSQLGASPVAALEAVADLGRPDEDTNQAPRGTEISMPLQCFERRTTARCGSRSRALELYSGHTMHQTQQTPFETSITTTVSVAES